MGNLSEHFDREEFRCKCNSCGYDTVDAQLLEVLEAVRQHFGAPVTITSAARCEAHNRKVGGSPNSQHLRARAADFVVKGLAPAEVADWLERTYPGRFGIGRYPTFTHIDTRGSMSRWSEA